MYIGLAHRSKGIKIFGRTRSSFRSSKTLTAIGAMELWESGKLDLNAPVQKYCPSFPDKGVVITTRELLGHLSGVRHYHSESIEDPEVSNIAHFDDPIQGGLRFFKND